MHIIMTAITVTKLGFAANRFSKNLLYYRIMPH